MLCLHVLMLCIMLPHFMQKGFTRPLTQAANWGHFALVKHMIEKHGCDVMARNKVSIVYNHAEFKFKL